MNARLVSALCSAAGLLLASAGCATAGPPAAPMALTAATDPAVAGGQADKGLVPAPGKAKASSSSYGKQLGPRRQRHEIKHADVEVITSDVSRGFETAGRLAERVGGHVIDSSSTQSRARISFRVPAARFDEALRRVRKLGKVDELRIRGEDVTSRVVDLELRLRTAQEVRRRYLELLARATDVAQALPVQKELERITMTVEQLEGQLNLLRHQVAYSTITVELREPTRPGPVGAVFYGLYRVVRWLFVWD